MDKDDPLNKSSKHATDKTVIQYRKLLGEDTAQLMHVEISFMRVSWLCGNDNMKFLTSLEQ